MPYTDIHKFPKIELYETLNYKYILDIDGNSVSWTRLQYIMGGGSVALKVDSNNGQWYYGAIKPFEHYVPIKADFSDLNEKIEWLKNNDDKAQQIAKNGRDFVKNYMTHEAMNQYTIDLLKDYEKLYFEGQ